MMFNDIKDNIKNNISTKKLRNIDPIIFDIYTDRLLSFFLMDFLHLAHYEIKNRSNVHLTEKISDSFYNFDFERQILIPKLKFKLIELFLFLGGISKTLYSVVTSKRSSRTSQKYEICLIYSLTHEQLKDANGLNCSVFFNDFFGQNTKSLRILETKNYKIEDESNIFAKNIMKYLLLNFSSGLQFKILRITFKLFFERLKLFFLDSRTIVGANHYFEGFITKFILDSLNLKTKFICTQTTMICNPGVFYFNNKKQNFMLWYSDNSLPIISKKKMLSEQIDLTYLKTLNIGRHYVLSKSFKRLMCKVNENTKIEVIYPFSFFHHYPISGRFTDKERPAKKYISYFPVTPSVYSKKTIYAESIMIRDLELIIKVINKSRSEGVDIRFRIKIKREMSKIHSQKYLDNLNRIAAKYEWIEILNAKADVVEEVRSAELVVCTPFTSVALIAKYLHKRVIYLSTASNFYLKKSYEKIPLVNNEDNLKAFTQRLK